jgi:very-short-patch-repair endonuclease
MLSAMDERGRRLDRVARYQLGLFTRAQALACGYSADQVRRRLAASSWVRVAGPVYARAGRDPTGFVRAAAAHLATPGSVVAGPSAAAWYGLPVRHPAVFLWTTPSRRCRLAGVQVFHDPLIRTDVRRADGMLITGPERTVLDCLRVLPDREALALLDEARRNLWISLRELAWRVREHAGRRDAPRLVRLMRAAADDTRSAVERRAITLLRRARITGWTANAEIRDEAGRIGYGDLVFDAIRLVVELDGWAYHSAPDRFQRDRTRQNRLVNAGWTVLRFTWADITERPELTIATIRAAVRRLGQ